jgi:hypothetical protein
MNEDIIPQDVRRFILLNIDSVAQLECLLLFHGRPGWQADINAVAALLYIPEPEASLILDHLTDRAFLSKNTDKKYLYQPGSPDIAESLNRLAEIYSKYLVPVTNLIHSRSKNRIQKFADAFRIRKE